MKPALDSKRTGVKATLIPWTEPPLEHDGVHWYGPPGAYVTMEGQDQNHWVCCCPGCGRLGGPQPGQGWQIVSGNFDDVATLTLSPSILRHCCGWHGYLRDGVFESC